MAIAVVLGVAIIVSLTIALAMFVVQRRVASRTVRLDAELTAAESVSGTCGACLGTGYLWENLGGRGQGRTRPCWRCGGSGLPPTAEDRRRFMPSS